MGNPYFIHSASTTVSHADFTAGALTETINIAAIPAKAQVISVICVLDETPDDSDGDLTGFSLQFGEDVTPDTDAFLTDTDYIAGTPGDVESTRGAALTTTQGFLDNSSSWNLTCTATSAGVNLDDADINAGSWTVYYTYIHYPS